MHNALTHWRDTPAWKSLTTDGAIRVPGWAADDPLADAFLAQWGDYPDAAATGIDYDSILNEAALGILTEIDRNNPLSADLSVVTSMLCRDTASIVITLYVRLDYPGVFVGDVARIEDLVAFWRS